MSAVESNLRELFTKVPYLPYVLDKLDTAGIRYGLYAGSHVAVLVSNRMPTDVDLLVHDDDLDLLKKTFPFAKTMDSGAGVFLYVGYNDVVEFMGAADVIKGGKAYPFRLTDVAAKRCTVEEVDGVKVSMVDPADTLLLKSILQRGPEQGKHDLEDIKAVLSKIDVDLNYLHKRVAESDALELTKELWRQHGVFL